MVMFFQIHVAIVKCFYIYVCCADFRDILYENVEIIIIIIQNLH